MFLEPTSGSLFIYTKDEIMLLSVDNEEINC